MAIALSTVNLLEAAYCVIALSTDLLEQAVPIALWVSMPSFVQWENLRKMPLSTWKKSHFCDNPKQSCMTNDTHRFLFRSFLCFVCLELVMHDKKSWNMLGAPALMQNS